MILLSSFFNTEWLQDKKFPRFFFLWHRNEGISQPIYSGEKDENDL